MKRVLKVLSIVLAVLAGIVPFWLFPLKLIKHCSSCPARS
jgi:hypothetical protein